MPISGASLTVSSCLAIGAACAVAGTSTAQIEPALRADIERIATHHVYFGHQSVGGNVLAGVRRLAGAAGTPLQVTELAPGVHTTAAGITHSFLPENGKPLLKLQSFERALAGQSAPDVALMKFCYVDFDAGTDAKALFASYRATLEGLKARYPHTRFVHVTVPLTTVQGGFKAVIKRLQGRSPHGLAENQRRDEYNVLLRQAFEGREPIFDLARIESTAADGTAILFEREGAMVPGLAPGYTDDGGHLNEAGQMLAARALLAVLATVLVAPAR